MMQYTVKEEFAQQAGLPEGWGKRFKVRSLYNVHFHIIDQIAQSNYSAIVKVVWTTRYIHRVSYR